MKTKTLTGQMTIYEITTVPTEERAKAETNMYYVGGRT